MNYLFFLPVIGAGLVAVAVICMTLISTSFSTRRTIYWNRGGATTHRVKRHQI